MADEAPTDASFTLDEPAATENVVAESSPDDILNSFLDDITGDSAPEVEQKSKPEPEKTPEDDSGKGSDGDEQEHEAETQEEPELESLEEDTVEAEKKTEEEPEPELPKNASEAAKVSWDKLRGSRDKYKAEATKAAEELKALQSQVEELRTKTAALAEYEEKLKNYDELQKTVLALKVEESDEYKREVTDRFKFIEQEATTLAQAAEGDVQALFNAFAETDPVKQRQMLKDATAGWDEIDRLDAKKLADQAREVYAKQAAIRANAAEAAKEREQIASQNAEREREKFSKEYAASLENAVTKLKDRLPFIPLRDGETAEDSFKLVAEKLKDLDFDKRSLNDKTTAMVSLALMPRVIQQLKNVISERDTLKEKVAAKNSAKPSIKDSEAKQSEKDKDFFEELGVPENPAVSQFFKV